MSEIESMWREVLLAVQLCLGLLQIVKLSVFGAITKASVSWLMSLLPFGLGSQLSPTYARLKVFDGDIFKEATCHVTIEADRPRVAREMAEETPDEIIISYLGDDFNLERRKGNQLFLNGEMSYYITDTIWYSLLHLQKVASQTVFLKGYKQLIWYNVVTGGVMNFYEVLDLLILEDHVIKPIEEVDVFLPINLSVSEEKLLKALNLVGLFLQTKRQVHWLIPTLLSFTAAVLEFSTPLRVWVYSQINLIFCCAMHLICDRLPLSTRRWMYHFGRWVENLETSNDLQVRVVKDNNMYAVIGGGAKAAKEGATLVQLDLNRLGDGVAKRFLELKCADSLIMRLTFDVKIAKCVTEVWNSRWLWYSVEVDCNVDEYKKLITFLSCMAKNGCGSLKSCDFNNRVHVRKLRKSVIHYAKSGFPEVYELKLENAVVN